MNLIDSAIHPQQAKQRFFEPATAWMAIAALTVITTAGIVAGAGSILRILFPALCFAIGVLLYRSSQVLYVGFTWWLWVLTPLIARLVDYRNGWDAQRLMLVSPYLVTLISIAALWRYFPTVYCKDGVPFALALAGVGYATCMGLVNASPMSVVRALLDWLTPIVFSFYFYVNWRTYPQFRQNAQNVYLWAVLVTGIYGIVQYLIAPEWDCYWLNESKMFTSAGNPAPLEIRVWSTMHSPGPYSSFMIPGALLLFTGRSPLRFSAMGVGYLSFLLSLVRSAWGSFFLGLIMLAFSLKAKLQFRLILTVMVVVLCILPLATMEPFSDVISKRLQTLSNIQEDGSFNDRQGAYQANLDTALGSWLGSGLGANWVNRGGVLEQVVIDSGVLDTLFTLGWVGTIPYFSGLILLFFRVMKSVEGRSDAFMSAARAVSFAFCAQLIFGSAIIGFSGILLWAFLGISFAADKYHYHQRVESINWNNEP